MWDKCVFGVCECDCICMHFRIKRDISQCYKTRANLVSFFSDLPPIFVDFGMLWSMSQCKLDPRWILICTILSEVHLWTTAAVRCLSTLRIARNAQPACLAVTFELLCSANAFSCQCHGRGWQHRLCPRRRHPLPAARGNPAILTPTPSLPPQQSQTNDFDLSSAVRGRSYRYNPPNDVKDLSAKLMNDKNSPPPSTPLPPPLNLKTPLLQAKKIESQETLLISSPCILTLTFLNRSSSYKGQSSSFCVLKCG